MRHNNLRDLNAEMQREVCRDVVVEPDLLPLDREEIQGAQGDRAAPDISSRGLWSTFERTFFDVMVLTPMHHLIAQGTLASCTKPWNEKRWSSTTTVY